MASSSKKKNILMLSEYFHPHWTGLAKAFLNLARTLADEGHEVTVLTTRFSPSLKAEEQVFNIRVIRSRCLFYVSRTHYSVHILLDFLRLARTADVVIINSPFSNILFAALIARCFMKKLVIVHQGDLLLARHAGSRLKHFFIERIFDLLTLPACALSDVLVTYTEDYAKHSRVLRHFPGKFQAVIPPIEVCSAAPAPEFAATLANIKEGAPLIGFAGRFVEEKGFDILLRAIPQISERYPSARFVFAGETDIFYEKFFDFNKKLLDALGDKVVLLGLLNPPELFHFFRSLDVFVLCSRSDCFALTQAEAAVCGVPLVVSNIPGARALVTATGCGELVQPEAPGALAQGVVKVLENHAYYAAQTEKVSGYLATYERLDLD